MGSELFWTALGSLAAVIALAVAIWQLRIQRRERLERLQETAASAVGQGAVTSDVSDPRLEEQCARAVDQLGGDSATAKIGALNSLERLAQNHAAYRADVISLICAYLKMPYDPPPAISKRDESPASSESAPQVEVPSSEDARYQEYQVRLAAQNILARHLNHQPANQADHWSGVSIDLRGGTLVEVDFSACDFHDADFRECQFVGNANFSYAQFGGEAHFAGAHFKNDANLADTKFADQARFDRTQFKGRAIFYRALFMSMATFDDAEFDGQHWLLDGAAFNYSSFANYVSFYRAQFRSSVGFVEVQFHTRAHFGEAVFSLPATFVKSDFEDEVWFSAAHFSHRTHFNETVFRGAAQFHGAEFDKYVEFDNAVFYANADYGETQFNSGAYFDGACFRGSPTWFGGGKICDQC